MRRQLDYWFKVFPKEYWPYIPKALKGSTFPEVIFFFGACCRRQKSGFAALDAETLGFAGTSGSLGKGRSRGSHVEARSPRVVELDLEKRRY